MEPLLSIIIPTHNSEPTIERCINSLTSQSFPREKFEIIVVDDGSTDKTAKLAEKTGADRVIVTESCFQGKARNIGVNISRGDLLAFIDSDCEAKEGWLETITKELAKYEAISGSIENGTYDSSVGWADYCLEFLGHSKQKGKKVTRMFFTCNGACTKRTFNRIGGFIETEASEDVLFGHALKNEGLETYFVPEIRIRHFCRTNLDKFVENRKKLGKFFVITRKHDPTLPYSFLARSRWLVPLQFLGKVFKTMSYSIMDRKFIKFISVFPIIILGIYADCSGSWHEHSKK